MIFKNCQETIRCFSPLDDYRSSGTGMTMTQSNIFLDEPSYEEPLPRVTTTSRNFSLVRVRRIWPCYKYDLIAS